MKQKKVKYILPDFLSMGRNKILIDIYEKYPEITRNDTCIYSFFGVFPNAIWNGGGTYFDALNTNIKDMKKVRNFYNKKGISIVFTFTNSLITEEHLNDEYCNQMLEIFDNGMNEVLVVSPILEKYIRENYPRYKINRSVINTEKIPFLLGDYHLSVISKFKNKDFEYLNSLTSEEKSRTELLCNEYCINNCPYAYKHYKEYAYIQLYGDLPKNAEKNYAECRYYEDPEIFLHERLSKSEYIIKYEDIIKTYVPMGFQYFKIAGREPYNKVAIEMIVDYCIKPEYQMDVRTYMLERLIMDYKKHVLFNLKHDPNYSQALERDWTN